MILREYVYLDDQRLALFDLTNSDATFYYINDHLGTAQILLDGQGVVVWQGNYKPFGKVDVVVNNLNNHFRFPGQIFDIESGLHYNWNRYYNPQTGRYISPDPIGLDGGLNLYAYVGGDQVNNFDQEGLQSSSGCLLNPANFAGCAAAGWGRPSNIRPVPLPWLPVESRKTKIEEFLDKVNARPDGVTMPIPPPPFKQRVYQCTCRVQNTCPDNNTINNREFAIGYGSGPNLSTAKKNCEKDAKVRLGATLVHHPSFKCIDKNGERIKYMHQ